MMRAILSFMLMLAATSGFTADDSSVRERTFAKALEVFDKASNPAEFRESARLFESLLTDGYQNGAVYYNIGNAYMRAGDYGRAIASYRKAQPFRPRDPYLDANLRQALAMAPGRLAPPAPAWWKNVLFWSDWLSYPTKFVAALTAFALGVVFASLGLLWRVKGSYWLCAAAVVSALLLSVDAGIAYVDVNESHRAVVVAETVARKGNGLNYEPAFDQPLKDGGEFTIIERRGEWVFGHFEGIGDGWVQRNSIAE